MTPFADVEPRYVVARGLVPVHLNGVVDTCEVGHVDGFLGLAQDGTLLPVEAFGLDGVGARGGIAADVVDELAVGVRCGAYDLPVTADFHFADVLGLCLGDGPCDHVQVRLKVASGKADFHVIADLDGVVQFAAVIVDVHPVGAGLGDGDVIVS